MKKARMGGTPATVLLAGAGVPHTLHAYEHVAGTQAYGEEAAEALGLDPRRVFKTLVAELAGDRGGELVTAVVPVAGQLDLKALAAACGAKRATMAEPGAAQRSTGYVLGGISPLGQRTTLRTVVDTSAWDFTTVHVSAGRRGLEVELAPDDLARLCGAVRAGIAVLPGRRSAH